MFECNYIHKTSEVGDYNEGITKHVADWSIRHTISETSQGGFLNAFADFVGVKVEDVQIDPCEDDPSRIEAQTLENVNGEIASPTEIEQWKRCEIELHACTYTVYVESVTRESADFSEMKGV